MGILDFGFVVAAGIAGVVGTLLFLGEETPERGYLPAGTCVVLVVIFAFAAAGL